MSKAEMSVDTDWILPAEIPFADLKAKDLEECVYWLLDAMGARDLEWRVGGEGGGAADGGRDLEATFYVPSPDGDLEPQRWWVECKGRQGTVEADQVKSAVNNATALKDLAYLVVATNTGFSNPTRDWVKQWQANHPRPRIKLWDRAYLERLLSRHPEVVLRLFSEALSPAGVLKTVSQRFWDRLEYSPVRALNTLWQERESLDIELLDRAALVANEMAHGNIKQRPWAASASAEELVYTIHAVLQNAPYLFFKAAKIGVDQEPLMATLAHLILAAVQIADIEALTDLIIESLSKRGEVAMSDEVSDIFLKPIFSRLAGELQDVCSSDCDRVMRSEASTLIGPDDPVETYWRALDPAGTPADAEPRRLLRIESHNEPCKVGFALDRDHSCPLFEMEPCAGNAREFLKVVERVSAFRFAEARMREEERRAEESAMQGKAKAKANAQSQPPSLPTNEG
jgi:hypothetical protein